MGKAFEELQLKDDFMFSVVMRNPKFCKPFLERVLGIKISRIEYPRAQDTIDLAADAKSVRLDIYVEDGDHSVYNIEMQTTENGNLPKRTRYYQGMIDLGILEKGENYRDLKRSFIIFVCTFDPFGEGRHIYTFENRCAQHPNLRLGDDAVKIFLNTKGIIDDITPEMKKVLDFIDGRAASDDYTIALAEEIESVRKNEKWRLDYMTLQMKYQEKLEQGLEQGIQQGLEQGIQQGLEQGIQQGLEQGIQQGMEQSKRQMALRMLQKNQLSKEEIALYTDLTIQQLEILEKDLQTV
ncbi:MAG: Rpn family recombination-promoting nuclease/putative transposase [Clostridium sp.]|nr:Rpn family recombination-promoting nuclease/putative transposase [Acetatifactor muris]MCM1562640.1 Rpn family recombination-promoting nuclease/putative transposase [Clostridium sp.]